MASLPEQLASQVLEIENLLEQSGTPLRLYNSDGSLNYRAVVEFLGSPEYEEYRTNFPDVAKFARENVAAEATRQGVPIANTLAKLGFSNQQMRLADQIDDTPPPAYTPQRRNRYLQRALQEASARSQFGRTEAQRGASRARDDRAYREALASIERATGGQSSRVAAGAQGLFETRREANLRDQAIEDQERARNAQRFDQLSRASLAEDQRLDRASRDAFMFRDMPLFNQRIRTIDTLRGAGIQNRFGALDDLAKRYESLARSFGGALPGMVYQNQDFDLAALNDTPADTVMRVNQLANNMVSNENDMYNIANNLANNLRPQEFYPQQDQYYLPQQPIAQPSPQQLMSPIDELNTQLYQDFQIR